MSVARVALLLMLAGLLSCALRPPDVGPSHALRISEVTQEGDATRRASLRLVIDGLEADQAGQTERARGLYARALQVDSGNPYAYLALARHHAEQGDAALTREHLARSHELFSAEGSDSPRVEVHIIGLRGVVLRLEGRGADSERWLARAARDAPEVWGDGTLDARELR